jgi:zinc protease
MMSGIRSFVLVCLLAAMVLGPVAAVAQEAPPDYRQLTYPELREVKIPDVTRVTLPNGMQLLLLEDRELPLIRMSARIRTGSIYEPADKIGLAAITGEVMRTGGTPTMTGDEIDEALEAMAASVETGIAEDYGWASLSVLKEDIDKSFAILAEILMRPAFRPDKVELAKIRHRSSIARRNDTPGQIASREFNKLIYGPDSVYARHPEYATIGAITRDDLVAFHKRFYAPEHVMLAVWGDFETDAMVQRIEQAFDGWKPGVVSVPVWPPVEYAFRRTVNLVPRPDLNQSTIYLGHIGGLRNDPDYFAQIVMNQVLGGGFTSRLFRNVRSRQGLAYSVFGSYGTEYRYPGVFRVGCITRSDATVLATQAMIDEVERMRREEVTDEELEIAKESFLNSFVFYFETPGQVVTRLLTYAYYGYPDDFLLKIRENVEKVTKADVLRVAKERLRPDNVQILVVGNPNDFDKPLSMLGPVRTIDITIPPPPAAKPAPAATQR